MATYCVNDHTHKIFYWEEKNWYRVVVSRNVEIVRDEKEDR